MLRMLRTNPRPVEVHENPIGLLLPLGLLGLVAVGGVAYFLSSSDEEEAGGEGEPAPEGEVPAGEVEEAAEGEAEGAAKKKAAARRRSGVAKSALQLAEMTPEERSIALTRMAQTIEAKREKPILLTKKGEKKTITRAQADKYVKSGKYYWGNALKSVVVEGAKPKVTTVGGKATSGSRAAT